MGGRGSSFMKQIGDFAEKIPNVLPYLNDKPLEESEMNHVEKELNNKNVIVYESVRKLPLDVMLTQEQAILESLNKSDKNISLLNDEKDKLQVRLARFSSKNTVACMSISASDFSNKAIFLNSNLTQKSLKDLEIQAKIQQDSGHWMKTDVENLSKYVIIHEFGHFIHHNLVKKVIDRRYKNRFKKLVKKYNKQPSQYDLDQIKALRNKISRQIVSKMSCICEKEYGIIESTDLSKYGHKSHSEMFAEVYAHAKLTKNPNKLGKTMNLFLNKKR